MSRTMLVEGELTGEDATVTLTTEGSRTADRQVPEGASRIDKIAVAVAMSLDNADAAVFYVRMSGRGIKGGGEQIIPVSAGGGTAVQSGADPTGHGVLFMLDDVDIPVVPGSSITVEGEMAAGDVGDATMVVWLGFA